MATAEVRAAWQRTVNRCFVQEDAKRAPKIACCHSASSSSKQVDASLSYATDGQENYNVGFMPFNRYSNLLPESRWWLQLQPNYGYQKALTNEQFNTLEEEMDSFGTGVLKSTSKVSEVSPQDEDDVEHVDDHLNSERSLDTYCINKKDPEVEMKKLKISDRESVQEPLKPNNTGEIYKLLEMDPICSSVLKQANDLNFDSDFPMVGGEKTEPWWRMTDRDELASFVAQRSLDLVENCDLPHPLNTRVKKDPYPYRGHFDDDRLLPSSKDLKAQTAGPSSPTVSRQDSLILGSAHGKQWPSSVEQSQYGSDKGNCDCPTHRSMTEMQSSDGDHSKAWLLEALRHSQTRAREAEKAAKQSSAEKDHILKLFFVQASHLLAYKHLFRLLQLENLYFQIKNNSQPISTLFPVVLPWTTHKDRKSRRSLNKPAKGKRGKGTYPRHDISKFTVAFALGLSLVGAGLLLGWTAGWLLPTF